MLTNRLITLIHGFGTGATDRTLFCFDHRKVYVTPVPLAPDGMRLSRRGVRILAQELPGLIDRALN